MVLDNRVVAPCFFKPPSPRPFDYDLHDTAYQLISAKSLQVRLARAPRSKEGAKPTGIPTNTTHQRAHVTIRGGWGEAASGRPWGGGVSVDGAKRVRKGFGVGRGGAVG